MPIIRHQHAANFTILPNALIRDKRLSLRDMGLLVYMISLPDDWEFSVNGLAACLECDAHKSIQSGLRKLQAAGYLSISRQRSAKGTVGSSVWTITDTPDMLSPYMEKPHMEKPHMVNGGQTKYLSNKETNNKETNTSYISFQLFWDAYPRKVSRKAAQRAFDRVKPEDVPRLMAALEAQKRTWTDGKFIPYPATWLKQERWEDAPEAPPVKKQPKCRFYIDEEGWERIELIEDGD